MVVHVSRVARVPSFVAGTDYGSFAVERPKSEWRNHINATVTGKFRHVGLDREEW